MRRSVGVFLWRQTERQLAGAIMIITPNEDDVFVALRAFLQDVLPVQSISPDVKFPVVIGQENRVPEPVNISNPKNSNYAIMWPLRMPRLSTNLELQTALGLALSVTQSSQCVIQIDIHGPEAFNNASIVSTIFRSSYAVGFFEQRGATIAPLYADDPRNMQFAPGGEQQYEDRYVVEANLQVNQTVTTSAESARTLELGLVNIDTDPAHWPNSTITVTP